MLRRTVLRFLNHLLMAENWASARLKPFAGQQLRLELGPVHFSLRIAGDGSLSAGDASTPAAVTVAIPAVSPLALLSADRTALLSQARISGTADLAEALAFIARNLSWDAEADLARFIGDIPAHRFTAIGRQALNSGQDHLGRLGSNLSEYFVDENPLLPKKQEIDVFRLQLAALSADLDRLDQQIRKLTRE